MTTINIIAAMSQNGVIGRGNTIPWHNSTDLQRFAKLTAGQTVVMGRKTFDSLGKKPLPGRQNIIMTKQTGVSIKSPEACFVDCVRNAIGIANHDIWVIGGAEIYRLFLPYADYIHLSIMELTLEPQDGDVFMPNLWGFGMESAEYFPAGAKDDCAHDYFVYSRVK